MKILRKLTILLLVCFTLTGCAEALGLAIGAVTVGSTWLVLDHSTNKAVEGTNQALKDNNKAAAEAQKQAWIGQCLLDKTNSPGYCVRRANEAFSPDTAATADTVMHEDKKADAKATKKSAAKSHRG